MPRRSRGCVNLWLKWALKAYQSTYGYEYQGDNLLLARINLLITFVDYMEYRWNEKSYEGGTPSYRQLTLFDYMVGEEEGEKAAGDIEAKMFDWRAKEIVTYNSLNK